MGVLNAEKGGRGRGGGIPMLHPSKRGSEKKLGGICKGVGVPNQYWVGRCFFKNNHTARKDSRGPRSGSGR